MTREEIAAAVEWAGGCICNAHAGADPVTIEQARALLQLDTENAELRRVLSGYVELGDDLQEIAGQQPECDMLWAERQQATRALLAGTDTLTTSALPNPVSDSVEAARQTREK